MTQLKLAYLRRNGGTELATSNRISRLLFLIRQAYPLSCPFRSSCKELEAMLLFLHASELGLLILLYYPEG